ncbi:MAG: carbohydrate ABC transporter permease [Armatimonadetes bacterium]|nr:carbohydrate ABC transporter permease [Armatimonadota bacterium]
MRRLPVYAWLLLVAVFTTGPFLFLFFTSIEGGDVFKLDTAADILPNQPSGEAYRQLWDQMTRPNSPLPLHRFLWNTVIICSFGVLIELLLTSLAAYPLARMDFKGKGVLCVVLLSALMLPAQANMIVNFVTIRYLGLFDTLVAVVLPSAVSVFGIFLMRQAYLVIPRELEDAARIDGCNDFWIWSRIMVPLSRPALGTLGLFSFVAHWNSFMWPLIILKTRELYPLPVGLSYMANAFDSEFRLVAAGSVLSMLPIILLFLVLQRQFVQGITAGAIK